MILILKKCISKRLMINQTASDTINWFTVSLHNPKDMLWLYNSLMGEAGQWYQLRHCIYLALV